MREFLKLLSISAGFLIFGSLLMFYIESHSPESEITSMLDAVWWTAATVTTVGYGDVVPVSEVGRIIGILYMFVGIAILGLFISEIRTSVLKKGLGKEFYQTQQLYKIMERIEKIESQQKEILNKLGSIADSSDPLSEKDSQNN